MAFRAMDTPRRHRSPRVRLRRGMRTTPVVRSTSFLRSRNPTWGTVENLAPSSCDVAAGPCINTLSKEVRPGEVFITFGGPQGHDDRMASCGGLANRPLAVV